jgi:heme exporter protein A
VTPLLELRGVTKRFGPVRALRGVDLALAPGESVALLGANGAGKTTLLRIVAGLARPTSGEVLVAGRPALSEPAELRRRLGHVSHATMLHDALSARENLRFAGRLHGIGPLRSRIDQLLRSLDLSERADEPLGQLSRGMQQRVAVARALLHDPEVLLLDEPWTGLDAATSRILTDLLHALRRRHRTVLLVTHDLGRALDVAERLVVVHQGRVAWDAPARGVTAAALERILLDPASAPALAAGAPA